MTELPFLPAAPDPTRPEREPRKRAHRHHWTIVFDVPFQGDHAVYVTGYDRETNQFLVQDPSVGQHHECSRCGAVQDPARSRRGRTARSRGNSIERETAALLGVRRVGQYGGTADIETPRLLVQVKSGPAWYSIRAERELDGLPVNAEQVAVLVAVSTPGPGRKRRRQVRMSLGDLVRRFGEHAQAVVWFDDVVEETP